jgi:Flp pilus assembly protein TadD
MSEGQKLNEILFLELSARYEEARGQRDRGLRYLRDAVKIEESMRPPNGAADPIKPSHELLGEMLLRAGQFAEAATAFDACLQRMPNRPRSLHGAATAYAKAGKTDVARERKAALDAFWKGKPWS